MIYHITSDAIQNLILDITLNYYRTTLDSHFMNSNSDELLTLFLKCSLTLGVADRVKHERTY